MTIQGIADRTRLRLLALLAEDRPEADRLMGRLRELRDLDDAPVFSKAVHALAHIDLSEKSAEKLCGDILAHRERLRQLLKRDPGLRVAVMDYLSNIEQRLTNPMIIETSQLEETERSAVTDSLTGLYNRRFFRSTLEREVRRSRRYGLVLSLVMLDLDGFKGINDQYGHLFGDLVLRRVARMVRRGIRESDMACRYGGEEFAVILPETDRLGSYAVAERIRQQTETGFRERPTGGRGVTVTVSGGIASYPEDARDPVSLVARADASLYRAKALGRNRIALHFAERRAAVRYPARPSVRLELIQEPTPGPVAAMAVNLSSDGALVETSEEDRPTDAAPILLRGGGPHGPGPSWMVQGRVVRVEPDRVAPSGCKVGIAFDRPLPDSCLRAQVYAAGQPARAVIGGRS